MEVCRRVRAAGREPYHYILLLTARTESQDLVEGMEAGADDYLTKPFNAQELRVRLRAGRRILDLAGGAAGSPRSASRTGHPRWPDRPAQPRRGVEASRPSRTRRAGAAPAGAADGGSGPLQAGQRHARPPGRRRGAARGGAAHETAVRRYDALGRYGGEEFLVVLPGCDGQAGQPRPSASARPWPADHLPPAEIPGYLQHRRLQLDRLSPSNADTLIRDADLALYQAKNRGRNQVAQASASEVAMAATT